MTFVALAILFTGLPLDVPPNRQPHWTQLRESAWDAERRGDSTAALKLFQQELSAAKQVSAPQYFIALEDIGNYFWHIDDARSAEPYFRTAVSILNSATEPHSRSRAIALNNLATVLRFTGAYDESEATQFRALREFQQQGHMVDVARCYASLAEISLARGDSSHAASRLKTASEVLESNGLDSVQAGNTLVWMAQNFLVLNMLPDAALAMDRARPMLEGRLPDDDAGMIAYQDTRAAVLFRRHRYGEAERIWNRALESAQAGHVDTVTVRVHLAQLYSSLGEYDKAAEDFTELLQTEDAAALTRGVVESELGWALLQAGHDQRAQAWFNSAMVHLDALGLAHSMPVATLCERYARLYTVRRDWNDALPLLQRAIAIGQHAGASNTADWLLERAEIYKKLGNKKEASASKKAAEALFAANPKQKRETVDLRELEAEKR